MAGLPGEESRKGEVGIKRKEEILERVDNVRASVKGHKGCSARTEAS